MKGLKANPNTSRLKKSRKLKKRGAKLKLGNGYLVERPLQLICDLDIAAGEPRKELNSDAEEFNPNVRPARSSKQEARDQIKGVTIYE